VTEQPESEETPGDGVLHNPIVPPTKDELIDELEARLGGTC
jgi:hypothetical protein